MYSKGIKIKLLVELKNVSFRIALGNKLWTESKSIFRSRVL